MSVRTKPGGRWAVDQRPRGCQPRGAAQQFARLERTLFMSRIAKAIILTAAAGAAVAGSAGAAFADAGATGAATGSPGIISGNEVPVAAHVPANVSGNTVNVI